MTQYCSLEEAYQIVPRKNKAKAKETEPEMFQSSSDLAVPKTYASQKSDYDYICKTTGVCVYPEKFKDATQSSPPASQPSSCAKLTAPNYEYPFTDEDKRRFRQALKVALEEMDNNVPVPATAPAPASAPASQTYVPRAFDESPPDMTNINGFIDEELESYMMVNDMKPAISYKAQNLDERTPASGPSPSPAPAPVDSLPFMNENFTKKYKVWFDLLLFTITGLLIILMLEQLFKLAIIYGMNKTVTALELIMRDSRANGD